MHHPRFVYQTEALLNVVSKKQVPPENVNHERKCVATHIVSNVIGHALEIPVKI
jgi:hypothetical protein